MVFPAVPAKPLVAALVIFSTTKRGCSRTPKAQERVTKSLMTGGDSIEACGRNKSSSVVTSVNLESLILSVSLIITSTVISCTSIGIASNRYCPHTSPKTLTLLFPRSKDSTNPLSTKPHA